jgi:hypothetical protein
MTNAGPPRLDPTAARPRPPRPPGPDAGSSARVIAVVAIVIAASALALTAFRFFAPGSSSCQAKAWDTTPKAEDLPADWTISATQYDIMRKTISFLGPQPTDDTSSQGVVYATITCFEEGAADSVTRSAKAAQDAGQSVIDRDDLGDGGFSAVDNTGATFLQLRHDKIVVYLAASGDASANEVDTLASAFDKALGGDGGDITPPNPAGSGDLGAVDSFDPNASDAAETPAAPDLEAMLPTQVGDLAMTVYSATGSTILAQDPGSRAILAALREDGREPDDLRVAEGDDDSGNGLLTMMVITVNGMPLDKLQKLVLDSWLSASGAGVTRDTVTLNGKEWTRIDYGDEGSKDYVRTEGNNVLVVTTADPKIAEQATGSFK